MTLSKILESMVGLSIICPFNFSFLFFLRLPCCARKDTIADCFLTTCSPLNPIGPSIAQRLSTATVLFISLSPACHSAAAIWKRQLASFSPTPAPFSPTSSTSESLMKMMNAAAFKSKVVDLVGSRLDRRSRLQRSGDRRKLSGAPLHYPPPPLPRALPFNISSIISIKKNVKTQLERCQWMQETTKKFVWKS